jgi:putative DNA primase/helicase
MTILTAALDYAASGLAIFPAPPDCKKSFKCAEHSNGRAWGMTTDAAEITADFTRWPDARIGLPTGAINGIVVLDIDTVAGHGVDGAATLAGLEAKYSPLPDTLQAISPSGSVHQYIRHPGDGVKIRNSTSEIGAGIDVRGDGGMVIAPPSPGYRWLNQSPIAPMPDWLIEITREKPPTIRERAVAAIQRPITHGYRSIYSQRALAYELAELAIAPKGQRNTALNRASFNLHQLVADGELDGSVVEHELVSACEANGLIDDDGIRAVMATIASGARAGLQHPRSGR